MTLRVGVAGAGQAGERHASGFAATAGVELVGIADPERARAEAVATSHGARSFADWRDLLELELDILVVALPHDLHLEPAEAAAARGVHLLMEKPIATTLDDGRRIVEVCDEAGVHLGVGFVHRFREELQIARGWLDDGAIGRPRLAREAMGGRARPDRPGWLQHKRSAGGGVLMYGAIHGIDRLRWLLDSEVVEVSAHTRRFDPDGEVEQGIAALLGFASGAVATLTAGAPPYRTLPGVWETELYGDDGQLRVRTRSRAELSSDSRQERADTDEFERRTPHYNFARQAESFVTALRQDRPPPVTGEDGLRALEVALAIYRSAEQGAAVTLTPPSPPRPGKDPT